MCNRLVASVVIMPLRNGRTKLAPNWAKLTGDVSEMDPGALLQESKAVFPGHSFWFEMAGCVFFKRPAPLAAPCFCCSYALSAPHITSEPPKLRKEALFTPQTTPDCNYVR